MSELLAAALGYAAAGRPVFPCIGKRPLTERGFQDASLDAATIKAWWQRWPDAAIGWPAGSGIFVLDVDRGEALEALEREHGPLPPTAEVLTSRGRHLHFRGEATNARGSLPAGLDVRGAGGYVLLPPSPHPSGGRYEWRSAPDTIAPAPAWLLELLNTAKRTNGRGPSVEGAIPAGLRNDTLASFAGTMRRRGMSEHGITAALLVENRDRCTPPLADAEVRKIARSIARYKPSAEAVASLDELTTLLGLAEAGKGIDHVLVYGRGSRAHVCVYLDDGARVVLHPFGSCWTPAKLALELASQAGATPTLKAPDVAQAVRLIYLLAEHHEAAEVTDRAWELGADYLRSAATGEVAMDEQASRWEAFAYLDRVASEPQRPEVVLLDGKTGERYVRTQWITEWLRGLTAPGEPAAVVAALERLGWQRSGAEGRIKATRPGFPGSLQWAFLRVPAGWEDE